jgi:hypothetical protein
MILLINENKDVIAYIYYEFQDDFIYISEVEVHPNFRGLKLCNKLIKLLILKFPNCNKFTLQNAGGLISYKCYTSSFNIEEFKLSHENTDSSNNQPPLITKKQINNNSKIIKSFAGNNNTKINKSSASNNNSNIKKSSTDIINNLNIKYNGDMTFIRIKQ